MATTGAEIEALAERLNKVSDGLERLVQGNTQFIIHRTEGPTPWLAAAIAVMFCTLLMLLLFAAWVIPMLHDLQAWRDIHQNHISALEAEMKKDRK